MERVVFLVHDTGERLACLLNPESVVLRRRAGVRSRRSVGGIVAGAALSDDPVLLTGGGRTELDLDLLFDVSLASSSVAADDVRRLTGPFWGLAENTNGVRGFGKQPQVRFFWGKWSVPGVVVAVAERLEYFTASGVPRRSWLRLRMRRTAESVGHSQQVGDTPYSHPPNAVATALASSAEASIHEIKAGEPPDGGTMAAPLSQDRLDQLADRYYGDARLWRLIARFNNLDDPTHIPSGVLLKIPPPIDALEDLG